jgi:hypothetical protein
MYGVPIEYRKAIFTNIGPQFKTLFLNYEENNVDLMADLAPCTALEEFQIFVKSTIKLKCQQLLS